MTIAGTHLCLPMEDLERPGGVDLGGWLDQNKFSVTWIWTLDAVIHPSSNRAQRTATLMM